MQKTDTAVLGQKCRLDALDALRGIAALAVVYYHFTEQSLAISGGGLQSGFTWLGSFCHAAVYVFFVLSGFILPWSMHRSGYQIGDSGVFLAKRMLRLYPPYLLTLLAVVIDRHGFFGLAEAWPRLAPHLWYGAGITETERYLGIFWTLELEVQFYLAIAVLYPLLMHSSGWISRLTMLAFVVLPHFFTNQLWLPHFAGFFGMGIAAFWWKAGRIHFAELVTWCVAALCFSQRDFSWLNLGHGLFALLFIVWMPKVPRLLVLLGTISYSLYLVHFLAKRQFGHKFVDHATTASELTMGVLLLTLIAIGFAVCAYYIGEKPAQYWSSKLKFRRGGDRKITGAPTEAADPLPGVGNAA